MNVALFLGILAVVAGDCMACELIRNPSALPGGVIAEEGGWVIEHCVGPLGVGTLILKPIRHVTAVAELTNDEAAELGPLLRHFSRLAAELVDAEQVYNTLWSHAGGEPGHVHYVIQPVTGQQIQASGAYGPALQMQMFTSGAQPDPVAVAQMCDRARQLWLDNDAEE